MCILMYIDICIYICIYIYTHILYMYVCIMHVASYMCILTSIQGKGRGLFLHLVVVQLQPCQGRMNAYSISYLDPQSMGLG